MGHMLPQCRDGLTKCSDGFHARKLSARKYAVGNYTGPLAQWIAALPAEIEEENYLTTEEVTTAQPAQTQGLLDMIANTQAAAKRQQALAGADRQHAAIGLLGAPTGACLVGGPSASGGVSQPTSAASGSEVQVLSAKVDAIGWPDV